MKLYELVFKHQFFLLGERNFSRFIKVRVLYWRPQKLMKSSPSIWYLLRNVKSMVKILSIFVAFLENMNFNNGTQITWLSLRIGPIIFLNLLLNVMVDMYKIIISPRHHNSSLILYVWWYNSMIVSQIRHTFNFITGLLLYKPTNL